MNMSLNHIPSRKFLSVYDESDSDNVFHVCRKLCCDHTYTLFQLITTRGYDDGLYLIPTEYIFRVDAEDEYTARIEKLFHLLKQPLLEVVEIGEDASLLLWVLDHARKNTLVTSLFLDNGDDVTGRILETDPENGSLHMELLNENGEKDGFSFIRMDNIEKIICNSGVERCIEMLEYSTGDGTEGQGDGLKPLKK